MAKYKLYVEGELHILIGEPCELKKVWKTYIGTNMNYKRSFVFLVALGLAGCTGNEFKPVTLKVAGSKDDKLIFSIAKTKYDNESVQLPFNCGFNSPVNRNEANAIRGFRVDAEIQQRSDRMVIDCRLLDHEKLKNKLANF